MITVVAVIQIAAVIVAKHTENHTGVVYTMFKTTYVNDLHTREISFKGKSNRARDNLKLWCLFVIVFSPCPLSPVPWPLAPGPWPWPLSPRSSSVKSCKPKAVFKFKTYIYATCTPTGVLFMFMFMLQYLYMHCQVICMFLYGSSRASDCVQFCFVSFND